MRPLACVVLALITLLAPLPLAGQSYQTNFSEMKFDRGKNPATFHGGAEVDVATGALSLNIPLGPGIGARGAVFVPTFRLRYAPQAKLAAWWEAIPTSLDDFPAGDPGMYTLWHESPASRPSNQVLASRMNWANLSEASWGPGVGNSSADGSYATQRMEPLGVNLTVHRYPSLGRIHTYELPDGTAGTAQGALPAGLNVSTLLTAFGYQGFGVAKEPGVVRTDYFHFDPAGRAAFLASQRTQDFVRMTSTGGILIGLKDATTYPDASWLNVVVGMEATDLGDIHAMREDYAFPGGLLLVQGDVAYEFQYARMRGDKLGFWVNFIGNPAARQGESLDVPTHAAYILRRIRNRVGDELRFDYTPAITPNLDAMNFPDDYVASELTVRWLRNGADTGIAIQYSKDASGRPQIRYAGVNHSAYTLTLSGNTFTNVSPYNEVRYKGVGGTTITQDTSGETIRLVSGAGPTVIPFSGYSPFAPEVVTEVQFPTHTVKLDWGAYDYARNRKGFNWTGFWLDPDRYWFFGVTRLRDVDTATATTRETLYQRIVPKPSFNPRVVDPFGRAVYQWDEALAWTENRHLTAVTHPDGGTTLYKYVQRPTNNGAPSAGAPLADQLQAMAFLKNQVQEERRYISGRFNWSNIDGSVPYLTLTHSDLELRRLGNPTGDPAQGDMPYTRKTLTVDADTGVTTTESLADWDATHFGWKTRSTTVAGGGKTFDRSVQRTYEFVPAHWLGPRVTWEQAMGKAAIQRTYDDKNRVATETHNDKGAGNTAQDPALKLTFAYNTLTQAQPDQITLTSTPALSLSGSVGASYTYDTFGYLKTIQPFGAAGYLEQVNDAFGRATAQYDMNRQRIDIQWRTDGRLDSITPPGEVATTYTYDPDFRGVTIQRGAGPKSQLRYNGFGELVLERRWNGSGTPSHRLSSYDTMGRKRWEALWDTQAGDESNWTLEMPPREVPTTYQRRGQCLQWGIGPNGLAQCVEWEIITTTGPPPPIAGMHYQYDGRGRLVQTLAPGNTGSTLSYSGLRKTVTSGLYWNNSALVNRGVAATTSFDSDALGRLVGVTDALNQPATYAYDDADRITQVIQTDPAYATRTQTRTWAYNTLGWMLSLTQPESGTTSYSAFDVNGKAWTTSYNGRVVNATFDALGRTLSAWAPDGSVNQAFTWDTAPANGKGKLRTATANGVAREMDYGGVGGRLSTLTRTVDGIPFVQRFTYDTYGNLSSRTYPDNKVQTLTPDQATGLPVTSVFNGVSVMPVATYDATHWGLTTLTLANGATSFFTYGPDQTRLGSLRHQVPGRLDRTWTYGYDDQSRLLSAVGTDVQNTVGFRQDEERYTYDALGRLKTAMVRDPWEPTTTGYQNRGLFQRFDYDPFGNRFTGNTSTITNWPANQPPATATLSSSLRAGLDKVVANVAFSRTDAAFLQNRLPASAGSVYDAQGNLTQVFPRVGASGESVNLAYDALGRVSSLSYGPTATRKSESYLHDDEGLRIRVWDGAKYRYNVYNEARQLVAQYEKIGAGSLTWKKDIVYIGTKELAEVSSDGKTYVTLNDHLGGPRFLYDGTTLSQQKFLPFGEGLADALSAAKFAKGFTNHEQTDASGLIYMQARFYAPWYGRFLSPDPARDQHFDDTQSWNIYSYCLNQPTMKFDPDGQAPLPLQTNQWQIQGMRRAGMTESQIRETMRIQAKRETVAAGIGLTLGVGAELGAGAALLNAGRSALTSITTTGAALWQGAKDLFSRGSQAAPAVQQEAQAAGRVGQTVWDSMKATQGNWSGTSIPKSFELATGNGSAWIHPNATEHLAEQAGAFTKAGSHGAPMQVQSLLTSFQSAVGQALKQGVEYGKAVTVGNWKMVFQAPKGADQLPAVTHIERLGR